MVLGNLVFWSKKEDDIDEDDGKRRRTNLLELAWYVLAWCVFATCIEYYSAHLLSSQFR
jgi:hypothetical protein